MRGCSNFEALLGRPYKKGGRMGRKHHVCVMPTYAVWSAKTANKSCCREADSAVETVSLLGNGYWRQDRPDLKVKYGSVDNNTVKPGTQDCENAHVALYDIHAESGKAFAATRREQAMHSTFLQKIHTGLDIAVENNVC